MRGPLCLAVTSARQLRRAATPRTLGGYCHLRKVSACRATTPMGQPFLMATFSSLFPSSGAIADAVFARMS
jgi:hypothetical protein